MAQDTEDKAKVDLETTAEHLRLLGNDPEYVTFVVDIFAPVTGVITDQQVTNAAGVAGLSSPNPFTISDLSTVWIICDVYENDLPQVQVGDSADIRLNAYPDGISREKSAMSDRFSIPPFARPKFASKCPIPDCCAWECSSPRLFTARKRKCMPRFRRPPFCICMIAIGSTSPAGDKNFRRVEVSSGVMLPDNMQEIISGINPGDQVVQNALVLQNTVEQ